MLAQEELRSAIESGYIGLAYSFLGNANDPYLRFVHEECKEAQDMFNSNLDGNRLALTLGPLIFPLTNKKLKKSELFGSTPEIVDLRNTTDGYLIPAGETVLAFTHEYIKFDEYHAALLVSKVTNEGLRVQTSYVDPGWEGIVLMMISNLSDTPRLLRFGHELARMFFFRTYKSGKRKNESIAHREMPWHRILIDGAPFPHRSPPIEKTLLQRISVAKAMFSSLGVQFAAAITLVASIGTYIYETDKTIKLLSNRPVAISGQLTIEVPKGDKFTVRSFELEKAVAGSYALVSCVSNCTGAVFEAKVLPTKKKSFGKLNITVKLNAAAVSTFVSEVKWAVIPPA